MKFHYLWLLGMICLLGQRAAQAQHVFTETNLSPYRQSFDALSGTVALTGNRLNLIPEVYTQAEFGVLPATSPYAPPTFVANDGSVIAANYYHFGYASGAGAADRALGGIAATTTADGIGYVGLRF